jgi:hypothetical protein
MGMPDQSLTNYGLLIHQEKRIFITNTLDTILVVASLRKLSGTGKLKKSALIA